MGYGFYNASFYSDPHEKPANIEYRQDIYLDEMQEMRARSHALVLQSRVDLKSPPPSEEINEGDRESDEAIERKTMEQLKREVPVKLEEEEEEKVIKCIDVDYLKDTKERQKFFRGGGVINGSIDTTTQSKYPMPMDWKQYDENGREFKYQNKNEEEERENEGKPRKDTEYASQVAAQLYASHHFGTNVYDTIRQGCHPDTDSNKWPKIGGQPTAIHCGHMGPAPACPLYLDSKDYFFKARRIAKVTTDVRLKKERLKEITDMKESYQQQMVEVVRSIKEGNKEGLGPLDLCLKHDRFVSTVQQACHELTDLERQHEHEELDRKLKELKLELEELGLGHLFGQINARAQKTRIPMYREEEEPEKPEKWSKRKPCENPASMLVTMNP